MSVVGSAKSNFGASGNSRRRTRLSWPKKKPSSARSAHFEFSSSSLFFSLKIVSTSEEESNGGGEWEVEAAGLLERKHLRLGLML